MVKNRVSPHTDSLKMRCQRADHSIAFPTPRLPPRFRSVRARLEVHHRVRSANHSFLSAPCQITAEQLLREAQERQEAPFRAPGQNITDLEELSEYQGRKRKEFEERIRYSRSALREWMKYASWEAGQNEFERARSVFERALDVDPRAVELWLRYADVELKARNVNHARNVYDRAVTLLPRVDTVSVLAAQGVHRG